MFARCYEGGQKRAPRESWSEKNTGVLSKAKARDPVSPEREAQGDSDACPSPMSPLDFQHCIP